MSVPSRRPKTPAAKAAKPIDATGELYQRRAFEAVPILVRQARAACPIYYSDIARELGMPNPRNMDHVLGSIGNSLRRIGTLWNRQIPPVQALVINKHTKLPGAGFAEFAPNAADFRKAPRRIKREIVDSLLAQIYAYPDWDDVLDALAVSPAEPFDLERSIPSSARRAFGSGGESADHREFKEFVAAHPQNAGLIRRRWTSQVEYCFPSGDTVDVVFTAANECVAVEVKARISGDADLLRGLFQCVKYQALLDSCDAVEQRRRNTRTVYVLEGRLPPALRRVANTLGVTVVENARSSPKTP